MAKIMNVDYEAIPMQSKQMRSSAQELNREISAAYASILNMHSSWYGVRYNALVNEFNKIIPQVNELLKLVVGEIPYALETVANNYALADKGTKVVSALLESAKEILTLKISNDTGMRFITAEVETVQKSVSTNFKNAEEKMNEIEARYAKVQWQSEAAEAFRTRFLKLKNEIIASFQNINTQFTALMRQAQQDIDSTERKNTVEG